jgi:ABC-type transport system substrate-binding protein
MELRQLQYLRHIARVSGFRRAADELDMSQATLSEQIKLLEQELGVRLVAALESGTLDVADLVPIPDADRLRNDAKYKLYQTHDLGQYFYAIVNCGQAPTNNKLVRQALNYAIDRQRFTDTVMKGFTGEPRALPWAKSSPAFDATKNKAYAFDLDKAKSLLAQSGLSNVEFDISWATAGYVSEYEQLATIIQSDLTTIGVKASLKPTDPPTFTQQGLGNNPPFNGMRLSAGAFTQLFEAADPTKRKQLYSDINDYLLDQSFTMAITPYPDIVGLRPNVMDMKYLLSTATNDRNIWLG